MSIKMIVMDMDGTLLNKDQVITQKTHDALIKAQQRGVKVVLASGRSYRTLTNYGLNLLMDEYEGYFICVNGAAITDVKTMETQMIKQLQPAEIHDIYQAIKPFEVEAMGVLDDTIYDFIPESVMALKKQFRMEHNIAEDVPYTAGTFSMIVDQRKGYDHIYYIKDGLEITCPVNKICIAHNSERIAEVYEHVQKLFGDKYTFARTSPQWLECNPKGVSKGAAILKLAQEHQINPDEIMVFGDGENDLSMFGVVSYAIAMGNAMDTVKAKAYDVTASNNEDGIALSLDKYIFNIS